MARPPESTSTPALLLGVLWLVAGCVPYEDRPLYARSRRSLTGETTTNRTEGSYPYPEERARLRIGMTRRAVFGILGRARREIGGAQVVWVYGKPGGRQLLLTFDSDRLASISD